ncbi:MAG: hypothetical protein SR1Q7_04485 [Quinella sp. 1Q7]|nr:hypothetical protein [Quinella sp. 1Q7]
MSEVWVDTNVVLRYLLRTFYGIDRRDIAEQLLIVLKWVTMERKAIMIRACKIFSDTKLDFVDCVLAAYHELENVAVFTFDKKLNNQLKREAN